MYGMTAWIDGPVWTSGNKGSIGITITDIGYLKGSPIRVMAAEDVC